MSCTVITGSWLFFLCLLLGCAFFAHLIFIRFCKSVAELQGREAEFRSNASNNDVGTNDFVREQFERVVHAKFDEIDDELVSLGWKIRRRLAVQVIALIVLIAFGVWIQSVGCF